MRRSKLYKEQLASLPAKAETFALEAAFNALKAMPAPKFDQTVEMAFRLGIDPRQSDQNIRGAVALPKGTGKKVRVAVIAADAAADAAKAAGADFVGLKELIDQIKGGWMDFDVLITTPDCMPQVRPLGRALGPRGLMPNPKTGTVTDNVSQAVSEAKAGRAEYRNDKGGCVQVPIGKLSFSTADLLENAQTVVQAVLRAKPAAASGIYMQNCTVSATMTPGLRIDLKELTKGKAE